MNCSNRFISGGEEKIFRVFEAPIPFVRRFAELTGRSDEEMTEVIWPTVGYYSTYYGIQDGFHEARLAAATQSELGLSNKETGGDQEPVASFGPHFTTTSTYHSGESTSADNTRGMIVSSINHVESYTVENSGPPMEDELSRWISRFYAEHKSTKSGLLFSRSLFPEVFKLYGGTGTYAISWSLLIIALRARVRGLRSGHK